ncbi:MAG: sulfur carrier protein ThiS [Synergistaceae bacterium]|nr:sulfur carrier protein ThiS [Synergistaceae bacterium]
MITVNGELSPWREGLTVQQLLDEKNFTFKMLAVWIGDNVVDKSRYSEAIIPDGAEVQVIHNISGG